MTEISFSLESIQKSARQRFFENYSPSFTWRAESVSAAGIHGTFSVGPDTASHPGLASKLLQKLLKAQELGFKVIRMTNFGTVRSPEIPKDMLLTVESYDAYWDYADRLSSCSQFITNLGCGYHDYQIMKQTRQPGSPEKLAAAVAEWVDGDALAAHYAFGADVFCTNDRAGKAGSKSIFYPDNLAVHPKHKLKDPITEIDIYAIRSGFQLVLELKSTLRPETPWEVYKRNRDLLTGIAQARERSDRLGSGAIGVVITDGYRGDYVTWRSAIDHGIPIGTLEDIPDLARDPRQVFDLLRARVGFESEPPQGAPFERSCKLVDWTLRPVDSKPTQEHPV